MNDAKFIRLMQQRMASIAVGPSTARNMGPKGTIKAAREFLGRINLAHFKTESATLFEEQLNSTTESLIRAMPIGAQHWGSCRKFLNIFLRDGFYNRFLHDHFQLNAIGPWLEVPLDSHVANKLLGESGSGALPKWKTVIGLTPEENGEFQAFANQVAAKSGTLRIHLDLIYWRRENSEQK